MTKAVVFMQNAWSPVYAGRIWPRASWLAALRASRSGSRLRLMTAAAGPGVEWWFDNTTREVGPTPDSVCPADLKHIADVLSAQAPDVVVCAGRQAQAAVTDVRDDGLLWIPHPAYRLATNALFLAAGRAVAEGVCGVEIIYQMRGRVEHVGRAKSGGRA